MSGSSRFCGGSSSVSRSKSISGFWEWKCFGSLWWDTPLVPYARGTMREVLHGRAFERESSRSHQHMLNPVPRLIPAALARNPQ